MKKKNKLLKITLPKVLFPLIVILGIIYIRYTWFKIEKEQSENVLQIARSIEATFSDDNIKALDVNLSDTAKPQYKHIKNVLKSVIRVNPNARFAYIFTQKSDKKIYFIVDSEPEDAKDYSPPGQEYIEAKTQDLQPFVDGKELVTTPLSDRWGEWVSVYIPIKDETTKKTIAVFGLDISAKSWNKLMQYEIMESSILVLLLLLILFISIRIIEKNQSLENEITERKQAEEALLESESQKAAILMAIPDLLFVFSKNGDFLDVYYKEESKLYMPKEAFIGKNIIDLFPPDIVDEALEAFKKACQFKELVEFSYSININTKLESFEARIVPASDDKVLAIVRDITELRKAEMLMFQSQERASKQRNVLAKIALDEVISSGDLLTSIQKLTEEIAAAINVERVSIWMFSDDKTILQCKSQYEYSTKNHSSGVILNCADFPRYFEAIYNDSRIHADDALIDPHTNEFAINYLIPKGITSMLDAGIYTEGELKGVVCLEHVGEKRNWHADEESFASTVASITSQLLINNERKQTDKILQDIIAKNPMSIQIVDLQGFTFQVNAAYISLFGTRPPLDYSVFNDFHLKQQGFEALLERVKKSEVVYFPDFYYNAHDLLSEFPDVPLWIQMIVFPLNDSNGNPKQYVLIHENITERKLAEQELIKAKLKAEESDRLKTAFLNNISHEIRTPFNGLLGFLSLIQNDNLSKSDRDDYISYLNENANRLMNTINDIVEISLIQTGQLKPKFTDCNIKSLTYELLGQFKREAEKKGLEFKINISLTKEKEKICTDALKLNTLLSVLIGNAIKFTKIGSVELRLYIKEENIEFSVKDTGIGIPADKLQSVFERFMQADVSSTRRFEGSGLGLSIAIAYAEMLGGKIHLESEEGIGSVFYFTL
ncbi:MAG: ATP-binding protein [Bacteroidales bacterium]